MRDEKLVDYLDLLAWGRHAGALGGLEAESLRRAGARRPAEAAAVHERAIRLRQAIYRIANGALDGTRPRATDLAVLNHELRVARTAERLTWSGPKPTWAWDAATPALDRVLWVVAQSAGDFFTTGDLSRLRRCSGEDCGWLFEDTSRNRARQWCDMRDCGNVAKVRRFRQRQRQRAR